MRMHERSLTFNCIKSHQYLYIAMIHCNHMHKKRYVIFGAFLLFGIVILIGCGQSRALTEQKSAQQPNRTELRSLNESACLQREYAWVPVPGLCGPKNEYGTFDCGYTCDIRTNDAGKTCYSNDECEGVCLRTNDDRDVWGYVTGSCSQYVYYTDVSDCPYILESKSKNETPYACA